MFMTHDQKASAEGLQLVESKKYLFENVTQIPNFKLKTTVVTCFIQFKNTILILKKSNKENQSFTWEVPCGKMDSKDASEREALCREMFEKIGLKFESKDFDFVAKRYVRMSGWDYVLHLYQLKLDKKPNIKLSEEYSELIWISIAKFKTLKLLNGEYEAFDIIFANSIWQKDLRKKDLILIKKDKILEFFPSRRLVINLIGALGSGKGTQGQMLSEIYGIPHISIGDLFRDELRNKTAIGALIAHNYTIDPNNYPPDEISLGIMSRRFAAKDCENGFILDGFPRTSGQATVLMNTFMRAGDIHVPIYMDVNENIIRGRLKNRYICPSCGYQVRGHEGNFSGYCPQSTCKDVTLKHRKEDVDEFKLKKRFGFFNENRDRIFEIIEKRDKINHLTLKGDESPEDVLGVIFVHINQYCDRQFLTSENSNMVQPLTSKEKLDKGQQKHFPFLSLYKTFCNNKGALLATVATTAIVGGLLYRNKKPTI